MLEQWTTVPGVEGTNFCSRRLPSHAFTDGNLGHETELDTCCMGLWSCHLPDLPHLPLTWHHNHLNSAHWPLWSCSCLETFSQCLSSTSSTTPEAERLKRVFAQQGNKCFTVTEEFDRWNLIFNDFNSMSLISYLQLQQLRSLVQHMLGGKQDHFNKYSRSWILVPINLYLDT